MRWFLPIYPTEAALSVRWPALPMQVEIAAVKRARRGR